MSKTAAPGIPIGWVVGPVSVIQRLADAKDTEILEMGIRNKVLFVPGGLYGAERGYVKFSFARANTQDIEEGIRRFGQILRL
ncbi:hypothetical protein [Alicyclobacillus ferrooxydans]|uniref:Aminotransferase class I/classII domain-containing protein n=1 Tax=Alicyclobacillus ferrooxydans TaxID=471514 RepID=A0A0N8PNQ9_9BACL|nr:hypothetical protein [Alicyclobacillus ferrooxydans]KPV42213.1 hypothetical protein AN477_17950 [Alicyclobacillus ferrooxydans]